MADNDYGDANPIADVGRSLYKKANSLYHLATGSDIMKDVSTPVNQPKSDTSWHDSMVKKAQDSYADSQKIPTQTKAQKRPAVSAKVQIKSSVKPSPTKQAGGK